MKIPTPLSPVTKNNNVSLITEIEVKDIINLYKDQCGINVTRFFNTLDVIEIYECKDTTYRFYYPLSVAGDGKFYEELQENAELTKTDYYRAWSYDHKFAWKNIKSTDKVLEIGCGLGMFLEKLKDNSIEATGLELNTLAVEKCKEKGLAVENAVIEEYSSNFLEHYDVVCAFQVLEHVTDINSFIIHSLKCLKKGGKLILSVPNNEPYYHQFNKYETLNLPPHHIGLWNLKSFSRLQDVFNIKMKNHAYIEQPQYKKFLIDVYFRAKSWANIKTLAKNHTISEKIILTFLMLFTTPISIWRFFTTKINSSFIVVQYQK
jgi:SAM-dependent methyltransferase